MKPPFSFRTPPSMIAGGIAALAIGCASSVQGQPSSPASPTPPPYAHVFVIVAENENAARIVVDPRPTPVGREKTISELAGNNGWASCFFGETHPSQPNYIALLGGDTFGIRDDDPYYCGEGAQDDHCNRSAYRDYVTHTVGGRHLGDQVATVGKTWRGYYEDLPKPPYTRDIKDTTGRYAAKHSGFLNFASVQKPGIAEEHLFAYDRLYTDIEKNHLPNFGLIVPNLCNDMHGRISLSKCLILNRPGLIDLGNKAIIDLVDRLKGSDAWKSPENMAIVITFDESDRFDEKGDPSSSALRCLSAAATNSLWQAPIHGGGLIPTIVITNHGGIVKEDGTVTNVVNDRTPYDHYSLLKTIEEVLGTGAYLRRAGDPETVSMAPLFAVPRRGPTATPGAPAVAAPSHPR